MTKRNKREKLIIFIMAIIAFSLILIFIFLVIGFPEFNSINVENEDITLVVQIPEIYGRWQDIDVPESELHFIQEGRFTEYFDGEIVDTGGYTISENLLILTYDPPPPCSELQCEFRFNYTLTGNTLILTSSDLGTLRYRLRD